MTRRELLERIGDRRGGRRARPDRRRLHAGSAAQPVAVHGRVGCRGDPRACSAAAATATPAPTPVPSPEAELIVYNWLDYIGEDVIQSFEEKYPVKVKYELFDDIEVAYEKLGDDGDGYDISFPIGVDVPRFVEAGTLLKLDQSLLPNLVNLGPAVGGPRVRPGQPATRSRMCGGRPASATTRRR